MKNIPISDLKKKTLKNISSKSPFYYLALLFFNKGYLGFCKLTCSILIHASDIPLLRLYLFP